MGRFINHSCDGNLTIQAVFAGVYRSTLLYHVGACGREWERGGGGKGVEMGMGMGPWGGWMGIVFCAA